MHIPTATQSSRAPSPAPRQGRPQPEPDPDQIQISSVQTRAFRCRMHDIDKLLGLCGLHFPICSGVLGRTQAELHVDKRTPAGSTSQTAFRGDHPWAQHQPRQSPPTKATRKDGHPRGPPTPVIFSNSQVTARAGTEPRLETSPTSQTRSPPPSTAQRPRLLRSTTCARTPAPDYPSPTARWGRGGALGWEWGQESGGGWEGRSGAVSRDLSGRGRRRGGRSGR